MNKINVLGTEYTIEYKWRHEDSALNNCDGYCDKTTKQIVVTNQENDCDLGNFALYQRKCMRHEIIHAFLFESGLHGNWTHNRGHDESYVDWIADQYPKLKQAFVEAGGDE